MQIQYTSEESPYRTGTLRGLTISEIEQKLAGIKPDSRCTADQKVSLSWRFLADGRLCGIWDYRRSYRLRGELSTYGDNKVFAELFGSAYSAL